MRTVIIASLFFCLTVCMSLLPVLSKSAINSVGNQARLHPTTSTTTNTNTNTLSSSTSFTELSTSSTTTTTTTTMMTTTSVTGGSSSSSTTTTSSPDDSSSSLTTSTTTEPPPYFVMDITEGTYIVIIIPAVMIVNSIFVFAIYYLPLRQLFYKIERYLQAFSKIRSGTAMTSPYSTLSNNNNNNNSSGNKNNTSSLSNQHHNYLQSSNFPTSSMVDTEGCRSRHRQTEEEIKAAQKRQRRRERKRLARARRLAKSSNNNNTHNTTDPTSTGATAAATTTIVTVNNNDEFGVAAVKMCRKSFHDEMIDLGIVEQDGVDEVKSKSDKIFDTFVQIVQLRDMEEHCDAANKLLERARQLLEERAEKIDEIARLEAKLGLTNNNNNNNINNSTGNSIIHAKINTKPNIINNSNNDNTDASASSSSSPGAATSTRIAISGGLNPIDIHMKVV